MNKISQNQDHELHSICLHKLCIFTTVNIEYYEKLNKKIIF